ncbi:M23 family metallopeptidase [Candidatus Sumerlaeota bacterium]|nr:M23 family metallopeptidase [Candidatus Sumerlaeota bacterium]
MFCTTKHNAYHIARLTAIFVAAAAWLTAAPLNEARLEQTIETRGSEQEAMQTGIAMPGVINTSNIPEDYSASGDAGFYSQLAETAQKRLDRAQTQRRNAEQKAELALRDLYVSLRTQQRGMRPIARADQIYLRNAAQSAMLSGLAERQRMNAVCSVARRNLAELTADNDATWNQKINRLADLLAQADELGVDPAMLTQAPELDLNRLPAPPPLEAHPGVNLITRPGEAIHALEDGTVEFIGQVPGFGKLVILSHINDLTTHYAFLAQIDVKSGQPIRRGDTIGTAGWNEDINENGVQIQLRRSGESINPLGSFDPTQITSLLLGRLSPIALR